MPTQRLAYIDALRGLAIVMVMLLHTGHMVADKPRWLDLICKFGDRGVLLFFLTSGLALAIAATQRPSSAPDFYARRFFRLAPMFYAGIVFYFFVKGAGPQQFAPHGISPGQFLLTALFLHGFTVETINSVVPGGWSIAAEAAFSAAFPILILLASNLPRALVLLAASVAAAQLWVFASAPFIEHYRQDDLGMLFVHWHILWNLPAFMAGLAVFRVIQIADSKHLPSDTRYRLGAGTLAVTLVALVLAAIFAYPIVAKEQWMSLALFSGLALALHLWAPLLLVNPVTQFIGRISYSLYVTHFVILWALYPPLLAQVPDWPPVARYVLLFTAVAGFATAVSSLTYQWIEKPAIAYGRRLMQQRAGKPQSTMAFG